MKNERQQLTIAVDCRATLLPKTGVGTYAAGLVRGLEETTESDISKLSFGSTPNRRWPGKMVGKLHQFGLLPAIDRFIDADVFIFPDFVSLPVKNAKNMVVIHDLAYRFFPESLDQKNRRYLDTFVPASIKQANKIIAVSEATKQDIIKTYQTEPDDVVVIHPGVDMNTFSSQPKTSDKASLEKYGVKPNAILFVGTIEPRKNLKTLVDAYQKLPKKLREAHQLVLAGGAGWGNEMEKLQLQIKDPNITMTGRVDDEDLPALYRSAGVCVLPSKFEGFGMPIIEAMACGTPVIGADNSSISEVVAGSGLLFPTGDANALQKQLERVLGDSKLSKQLSEKGIERATQFSWQKSAEKLAAIIEGMMDKTNG